MITTIRSLKNEYEIGTAIAFSIETRTLAGTLVAPTSKSAAIYYNDDTLKVSGVYSTGTTGKYDCFIQTSTSWAEGEYYILLTIVYGGYTYVKREKVQLVKNTEED